MGRSDQGHVAQTLFSDGGMKVAFRLDGIVTLVDAKHISLHLDDAPEAKSQIAFADRILLNKVDLVTPAELDAAMVKVRELWEQKRAGRMTQEELGIAMGYQQATARKSVSQFLKSGDPPIRILRKFARAQGHPLAGHPVARTDALSTADGFKFFLADGSWLLIRASGTEPLVRIYTETTSAELRDELGEDLAVHAARRTRQGTAARFRRADQRQRLRRAQRPVVRAARGRAGGARPARAAAPRQWLGPRARRPAARPDGGHARPVVDFHPRPVHAAARGRAGAARLDQLALRHARGEVVGGGSLRGAQQQGKGEKGGHRRFRQWGTTGTLAVQPRRFLRPGVPAPGQARRELKIPGYANEALTGLRTGAVSAMNFPHPLFP